jgi:hypothetical protein
MRRKEETESIINDEEKGPKKKMLKIYESDDNKMRVKSSLE